MKKLRSYPFTGLVPDSYPKNFNYDENWFDTGGRWVEFGHKKEISDWVDGLAPYIDSREIHSAKYVTTILGRASAIIVYTSHDEREKTRQLMDQAGIPSNGFYEPVSEMNYLGKKLCTIARAII